MKTVTELKHDAEGKRVYTYKVTERWVEHRFCTKTYLARSAADAMRMAEEDVAFHDNQDTDINAFWSPTWTVTEQEQ